MNRQMNRIRRLQERLDSTLQMLHCTMSEVAWSLRRSLGDGSSEQMYSTHLKANLADPDDETKPSAVSFPNCAEGVVEHEEGCGARSPPFTLALPIAPFCIDSL